MADVIPLRRAGDTARRAAQMIARRQAIGCIAAVLAAAVVPRPARAADSFDWFLPSPILPLLVDLSGWTGDKPHGPPIASTGYGLSLAGRDYQRGNARVIVSVITLPPVAGSTAIDFVSGIDNRPAHTRRETIDGFDTAVVDRDKVGTILVEIAANILLVLAFQGITSDEAFGLAARFDWKAMRAALPT